MVADDGAIGTRLINQSLDEVLAEQEGTLTLTRASHVDMV